MKKLFSVLSLGVVAAAVFAQSSAIVYSPNRSLKDQSISVRAWGSGAIAETDELAYEGVYSIRVSTRNFFAGGFMALGKSVDLASSYADKNSLLRFQMRISDVTLNSGGGGVTGGGRPSAGGASTGGGLASGEGGGRPGTGGAGAPPESNVTFDTNLRMIRLIVGTTDGKKSEVFIPVTATRAGDRGWTSVAVPIQAIKGLDKTNKNISEIGISGDATTTFYVGDIRVVNDSTPITGGVRQTSYNLALGDEIDLGSWGFGGSSVLKYTWDFDAADGIQEEAEGSVIKRKFRKAGTFKVTLTISDAYGLKKPYSTTIDVKVNP